MALCAANSSSAHGPSPRDRGTLEGQTRYVTVAGPTTVESKVPISSLPTAASGQEILLLVATALELPAGASSAVQ